MVLQTSSSAQESEEVRCGTIRSTMKTNALLSKPELGKVKKILFNNPPPEHVFGYTQPGEPEGAREVTMIWKDHKPSPSTNAGKAKGPKPDFKAMNKLAISSGVTSAKQLPAFRESHMVLSKDDSVSGRKAPQPLPSSKDPTFTYGMASAHRSAEVVRSCGPEEPPMKRVVQGAYQEDWVKMNVARGLCNVETDDKPKAQWVKPELTKAAVGHSIGANRYLHHQDQQELWKMSKFKTVDPKVTQFMSAPGAPTQQPVYAPPPEAAPAPPEEVAQAEGA